MFARLESAAHNAATSPYSRNQPTRAQREAGRYAMGRVQLHGLNLRIENPRNSYREKVDRGGKAWRSRMAAHYGDIPGTRGNDGDPIDVFIGPFPESTAVWVVNQRRVDGEFGFDEIKVMLGFVTEQQARGAYMDSYDRGWNGLMSIVPASVSQFKWWLQFGDKSRPFSADQLPYEGTNIMDKVLWNNDAEPATKPLHRLMYDLRIHDAKEGLMLDAVTMEELMGDPDIESTAAFDALVVEVSRMTQKMDMLKRVMESAGATVKPTDVTISDPVRARGVLQVMVLFQMSDGQTVSVWFHNPDTTPAKLMPLDELISWKWMLNKKDVTIVVAPEKGRDLNIREVARRVMRLVERNSEAFQKANARASERAAEAKALDEEISGLEGELTGLQRQIEVARVVKVDADAATQRLIRTRLEHISKLTEQIEAAKKTPEQGDVYGSGRSLEDLMNELDDTADEVRELRGEATQGRSSWATWQSLRAGEARRKRLEAFANGDINPDAYADIMADPELQLGFQNQLDSLLRGRIVGILDALRGLGWEGDGLGHKLTKMVGNAMYQFTFDYKQVGASANIVGLTAVVQEMAVGTQRYEYVDNLRQSDAEFAGFVDATLPKPETGAETAGETGADPVAIVDAAYQFADATEAFKRWVADSVNEDAYSPFATAKAMDQKARELGASLAWDVRTVALDSVLDDAGQVIQAESVVGEIKADGKVAGRAHIGRDGKAMVYVGELGATRVRFSTGTEAMWSDDDAVRMVEALLTVPQGETAPAADEPEQPAKLERKDALPAIQFLRDFMSTSQIEAIGEALRGEEQEFFIKKLIELAERIKSMPKTRETDGQGMGAVAHLHYFKGGMDWYITEKDMEAEQLQAYGWADLGQGGGELGYINIVELVQAGVELDMYFDPKPRKDLVGSKNADEGVSETVTAPEAKTEPEPAPVVTDADPAVEADKAYLKSMIDGTADMLAPDVFDRLEPMFARYENDAAMMELLNRAAMAYSDAAVKAAQSALAA